MRKCSIMSVHPLNKKITEQLKTYKEIEQKSNDNIYMKLVLYDAQEHIKKKIVDLELQYNKLMDLLVYLEDIDEKDNESYLITENKMDRQMLIKEMAIIKKNQDKLFKIKNQFD